MGLVSCRTCSTSIASDAARCPNCGAKRPRPDALTLVYRTFWFLVVLSALARIATALR